MAAKRVLIADDDPLILRTIRNALAEEGYEVIEALNGREALEKAKQQTPHLIILDDMMPEMSGSEVLKELRTLKQSLRKVPIILLTCQRPGARSDEVNGSVNLRVSKLQIPLTLRLKVRELIHRTERRKTRRPKALAESRPLEQS